MKKFISFLKIPWKALKKDKILWVWIVTTLLGGFFPLIISALMGNFDYSFFSNGNVYIFAITMNIPIIGQFFIMLLTSNIEKNQINVKDFPEKKLKVPILDTDNTDGYFMWICWLSIIMVFIMYPLYLGTFKGNIFIQLLLSFVSIYLGFYLFCVQRLEEHPTLYEDYMMNENKDIEDISSQSKILTQVQVDNNEVKM